MKYLTAGFDLFTKVPTLDTVESSYVQEIFPTSSLGENSLEFQFMTDRNVFLDLRNTKMLLKVVLDYPFASGLDELDQHHIIPVNNLFHSLFSNCEVFFNNELVYSSNSLHAHKALISNEFNGRHDENKGLMSAQGYTYEPNPGHIADAVFIKRENMVKSEKEIIMYGRLAIDAFTTNTYLRPGVKVRVKFTRSRSNFYFITDQPQYKLKFNHASLFTRNVTATDDELNRVMKQLEKEPARYNFFECDAKSWIIPTGQNRIVLENVFNNAPIRRLAIAMGTNAAIAGESRLNPFHYQKFGLREIRISRGGQMIVQVDTSNVVRCYDMTMESMTFNDDPPDMPLNDFENHFIQVYDITSLHDAGESLYYPELIGGSIRVELIFNESLADPTEVIILGERLSTILIDRHGTVAKNV